MDLTKGLAFIGKIEVLAPLNELQIAMAKRIIAAETKTKFAAAVLLPIVTLVGTVTARVSYDPTCDRLLGLTSRASAEVPFTLTRVVEGGLPGKVTS